MSVFFFSLSDRFKLRFIAYSFIGALCALLTSHEAVHAGSYDVRTLTLYNTHSGERVTATFRINGRYLAGGLRQFNWLLRDWRYNTPAAMDPRLYDLLWTIHRLSGSRMPIHILSGYRSHMTNALLRRSSNKVAKHSQHTTGRAVDFYLPDVPMHYVRALAMRLQQGGVGYYPHSRPVFVHVDVGGIRAWPRMTREELLQIFPDGRTVHLPSNSGPLPGYLSAKAEMLAQGGAEERGLTYARLDTGPITENGVILTQFANYTPPTPITQGTPLLEKSLLRRFLSHLPETPHSHSRSEVTPSSHELVNLLKMSSEEAEDSTRDGDEAPSFAMPIERPSSSGFTMASFPYHSMPVPRSLFEKNRKEGLFSHAVSKTHSDKSSEAQLIPQEEGAPHDSLLILASLLNSIQTRNETIARTSSKGFLKRRHIAARKL